MFAAVTKEGCCPCTISPGVLCNYDVSATLMIFKLWYLHIICDQYNIVIASLVMQGAEVGKRVAGNGIGAQNYLHDKTAPKDYANGPMVVSFIIVGRWRLCSPHMTKCSNRPDSNI